MIVHKCDRCEEESKCVAIPGGMYEFCPSCYQKFVDFLNCRDMTSEGIFNVLVQYGQNDRKFGLGETIKYTPMEVKEILDGVAGKNTVEIRTLGGETVTMEDK